MRKHFLSKKFIKKIIFYFTDYIQIISILRRRIKSQYMNFIRMQDKELLNGEIAPAFFLKENVLMNIQDL